MGGDVMTIEAPVSLPTRPIMRYHGGKWRLAPWVIQHMPAHRIYVEPFGGAGSVLLRKERSYAEVYNDLDGEIVNLFRVLRDPRLGPELAHLVALTPYAREEFRLSYEQTDDPLEQARRTLIRSAMGYNSSGATRRSRTGFRSCVTRPRTTPAHDWAGMPAVVARVIERLRGVLIEHGDALAVIARYDGPEALIYCDPPYLASTRSVSSRTTGYRQEMDDDAHRALARALMEIEGMAIISGYPSALYDELYANWPRIERRSHADMARPRREVLWISPRAWAAVPQPQLMVENERGPIHA